MYNRELQLSIYYIDNSYKNEDYLYFDIETTGFSPKSCFCYLIGAAYCREDTFYCRQWLAETPDDEGQIIQQFTAFLAGFKTVIHFNGESFDIPFLSERAKKYNISLDFSCFASIDLFKSAKTASKILKLENYKQKTVESFLDIERKDVFSGGELTAVYKEFLNDGDSSKLELLLLHNHDDIAGLVQIFPVRSYEEILRGHYTFAGYELSDSRNYEGRLIKELIISAKLHLPVPVAVMSVKEHMAVRISKTWLKICIPVYEGVLKYFYPNYKDYYYLTNEDTAIHKSVAVYVDDKFRCKATRQNCYTKKDGAFIPTPPNFPYSPAFKKEESDTQKYIAIDDKLLSDSNTLMQLISYALKDF